MRSEKDGIGLLAKLEYVILAICTLFLTSCFEDEGNYKYSEVDDIEIVGVKSTYKVISFVDKLEIPIQVNTNYTDLSYEWYVYDPKEEEKYNHDETYEAELISTDKDLSFDVGWQPGVYTVMVKVTSKTNGYAVYAETSVEVVTELSRGFYILKETNDGNTELDLWYDNDKPVAENLIAKAEGEPMQGKPLYLGVLYGHGYINPESDKPESCTSLCVSTENGEIVFFKTDDFLVIHNADDIRYGGLAEGEVPITAFTFGVSNFYVSNKAVSGAYATSSSMGSTGVFATTSGSGASRYFIEDGAFCLIYWNEGMQCLDYADQYSFGHGFFGNYNENGFATQGMDCLACGSCHGSASGALNYFLLQDPSGKKYIYYVNSSQTPTTTKRVEIPATSKLANASLYATNALTATFLYYVYNNQLYVYNLANNEEEAQPQKLAGIPSGETITYLSYQYMNSLGEDEEYDFTHLMVGTQSGDTYKIYMYDISGGYPNNLVRTITGEGKLVMCNYASPKFEIGGKVSLPNR